MVGKVSFINRIGWLPFDSPSGSIARGGIQCVFSRYLNIWTYGPALPPGDGFFNECDAVLIPSLHSYEEVSLIYTFVDPFIFSNTYSETLLCIPLCQKS